MLCFIPSPVPMSERSTTQVCSCLIAGIAGSNPTEGMDVSSLVFVVCSVGRGLCDCLISSSEESYLVCVCV
jgi:hypothetical protein